MGARITSGIEEESCENYYFIGCSLPGRCGRQNSGLGKLCCKCLEMELVMEERGYIVSKNMEKDIWKIMYDKAREVQNEREVSPFIEAGGVAAAILTKSGNIYVGVCIDTASTLGMCAERNAIANMITNGESKIDKMVAVVEDGSVGAPCGACREYMMQLDKDSGDIEILMDYETRKTVRLIELIPDWWGHSRFK